MERGWQVVECPKGTGDDNHMPAPTHPRTKIGQQPRETKVVGGHEGADLLVLRSVGDDACASIGDQDIDATVALSQKRGAIFDLTWVCDVQLEKGGAQAGLMQSRAGRFALYRISRGQVDDGVGTERAAQTFDQGQTQALVCASDDSDLAHLGRFRLRDRIGNAPTSAVSAAEMLDG